MYLLKRKNWKDYRKKDSSNQSGSGTIYIYGCFGTSGWHRSADFSPIRLTDGLESLLGPLKKIKVPVHELAMMMSIALRFIPTLIEETDKIMSAQKARGADFETGSLMQRAKALVPLLVPLFVSAFRRADELATAMECRCYHGDEGRTKLNVLHYQTRDYLVLGYYAVLVAAVIALR